LNSASSVNVDGTPQSSSAVTAADEDIPLPSLKDIVIGQWTFKNNGTIFREEDWNRLKKIGAYGGWIHRALTNGG
jgi:hypothetical protein